MNIDTSFISVIIPNLNSQIIVKTIQALENQTYDHTKFEVIIVGIDQYNVINESELIHFDRSIIPLSPAQARNRGVQKAIGNILLFTDADCIPINNWVENYARLFMDPNIFIIGGGVILENNNYWVLSDNISMFYEYYYKHSRGYRQILPSLNLGIRREVFEEVGGFNENYPAGGGGEDADLSIRIRKLGYLLYFDPHPIVIHTPPRTRLINLIKHSYTQGKYSTKVDLRYSKDEGLPWLLRSRYSILLLSPFISLAVTIRLFLKYNDLLNFWYTFPAILLSKFIWCIGAFNRHEWK